MNTFGRTICTEMDINEVDLHEFSDKNSTSNDLNNFHTFCIFLSKRKSTRIWMGPRNFRNQKFQVQDMNSAVSIYRKPGLDPPNKFIFHHILNLEHFDFQYCKAPEEVQNFWNNRFCQNCLRLFSLKTRVQTHIGVRWTLQNLKRLNESSKNIFRQNHL